MTKTCALKRTGRIRKRGGFRTCPISSAPDEKTPPKACRKTRAMGGHVDALLCDDKGYIFKALFGLAGQSVHDSELRGVICALHCLAEFEKKGIKSKIGVASGEAFVGVMRGGSGT